MAPNEFLESSPDSDPEVNEELEKLMREMFEERRAPKNVADEFISAWRQAGYRSGVYGSACYGMTYRDNKIFLTRA